MFRRKYHWFSLVFQKSDGQEQICVRFRHYRLGHRRIEVIKSELGLEPGAALISVMYRGKMTKKQWETEGND